MAGPGCAFGGYAGGSVSTGYCLNVILTSPWPMVGLSTSVVYDTDNGLAVQAMYEWIGPQVTMTRYCSPVGGLEYKAGGPRDRVIERFDCLIDPPVNPPVLPAGTYRITRPLGFVHSVYGAVEHSIGQWISGAGSERTSPTLTRRPPAARSGPRSGPLSLRNL